MITCECPLCGVEIDLKGCEEDDIFDCPGCGEQLEVVALFPAVLEPASEEDEDWE